MGEVYRARDSRLGRIVALKVLPERTYQDPELRARLEREAQTISKLSHPNICTLHDIGEQDGVDFLVLEFVEGETLRELLCADGLPMHKVIPIAVQIAEGLAKAHEQGVIHRDLKPENLMVSAEAVKILDFGLAKLELGKEEREDDVATVTDLSPGTTTTGLSGTPRYMSPEQAGGQGLDFRSDQFSFGLVLYEMVTGRHAFKRKTQALTLAAILRDEPKPIVALNPLVPPPLCWVIERCLSKEPEKRYFSTRDLLRDLIAIRDRLSDLHSRSQGSRPSNLPEPSTAFVGRAKELEAIRQLMLRTDVRLITVTGPGGIGKSRLAIEVARSMKDYFTAGAYFVALAAVNDPGAISLTIAQTLGLPETRGLPPLDILKEYLRNCSGEPMLLLIDNFEHLVASAPMLTELLALASGLKILVTSRAALHVYNEQEFPAPPLALPDVRVEASAEELGKFSAISLFVQRAAAAKPDFALTEENAPIVAEICARLDGLPLAIELAAARVKLLSVSAMRARLASSLQLLTGGARDLPARQQTLRQAIDWSYDLLPEPEQKLFRRLAVFRGGCALDAVEAVCDAKSDLGIDVLDGMSSMVNKSLIRQVEQSDGEPRFVMLETIREYALEKMKACGEEPLGRRAHAAYCLVVAEEGATEEADASQDGAWMERFEIERDNFRAALDWLTETRNAEWGLRLAAAQFRYWELREYLNEGRTRLEKLLKLEFPAAAKNARVRALFAAGVLAVEQGDYSAAQTHLQDSLELATEIGDKRSMAVSTNALAVNTRDQGDLSTSRKLFEQSLGLWRELDDPRAVARALSNLAGVLKLQEDYVQAGALYDECLSIFHQLGDATGVAWGLNHQGDVARTQGDYNAARMLYEQSLATFRQLDDQWGIAGSLADLGNLAREEKEYRAADALYRESLAIFKKLEQKRGIARLLESFACSAAGQAQAERSLRLAGAAAALRQSIGAPLSPLEQAKLERSLDEARCALPLTASRNAWLEGWVMPVEQAMKDLLRPAAESADGGG
jgi:predicted ATPase/tRNA A-37 threonylcarbamoyl transferase component Bud32